MPNLKKFVALSLGAVCLLSSCNHTVDKAGAIKFVKENFTAEKEKSYKGIEKISYTFKASTGNKKDETKETVKNLASIMAIAAGYTDYKEGNTSFNCNLASDSALYKNYSYLVNYQLNEEMIEEHEKSVENAKYTYTISRDELSVWSHYDGDVAFGEYKGTGAFDETNIYSNIGHCRYSLRNIELKVDNVAFTVTETYTVTFNK